MIEFLPCDCEWGPWINDAQTCTRCGAERWLIEKPLPIFVVDQEEKD